MTPWPGGHGQKGQALDLLALAMVGLIGFVGLTIDAGRAYSQRRSLEAAAEAAAHAAVYSMQRSWDGSGFGGLTDAQVRDAAQQYASANGWNSSQGAFYMTYVYADYTTTSASLSSSARGVLVQLSMPQEPSFSRAVGINTYDIFARASAMFGSSYSGFALPIVINDDAFGSDGFYKQVGLQPANGPGNIGQYNFASIVPPGCTAGDLACYTNAMRYGSSKPIVVPNSYSANTFDMSALSKTSADALQARIDSRPNETCTKSDGSPGFMLPSPRVVLLPVINGNVGGGSVTLIRFRSFFISSIDRAHDPSGGFYGCFVKATVSGGSFDPNAVGTGYGGTTTMKLVPAPGTVQPVAVRIQSVSSPNHPGENASISISTQPNAVCSIVVRDPQPSMASGLGAQYADSSGKVTWTWTVDENASRTQPATVDISCTYQALVGRAHTSLLIT